MDEDGKLIGDWVLKRSIILVMLLFLFMLLRMKRRSKVVY